MNKLTKVSVISLMSLGLLAGCTDNSDKSSVNGSKESTAKTEKVKKDTVKKEPIQPEELGEGTFNIANESGSTADGKEIIIFYKEDTYGQGFSIDVEDFDGSQLTHILVDGKEIETDQLGTTQTSIILDSDELGKRSDALTVGKHTIQLVQYSDPDDTSSEPSVVKTQHYTVKDK